MDWPGCMIPPVTPMQRPELRLTIDSQSAIAGDAMLSPPATTAKDASLTRIGFMKCLLECGDGANDTCTDPPCPSHPDARRRVWPPAPYKNVQTPVIRFVY